MCQSCTADLKNVAGFATDGVAVMVGKRTGVATRLKKYNPEMISIHCGAHRLALVSSHAANIVACLKRVYNPLITLFYFIGDLIPRSAGHTLLSSLSINLFDV